MTKRLRFKTRRGSSEETSIKRVSMRWVMVSLVVNFCRCLSSDYHIVWALPPGKRIYLPDFRDIGSFQRQPKLLETSTLSSVKSGNREAASTPQGNSVAKAKAKKVDEKVPGKDARTTGAQEPLQESRCVIDIFIAGAHDTEDTLNYPGPQSLREELHSLNQNRLPRNHCLHHICVAMPLEYSFSHPRCKPRSSLEKRRKVLRSELLTSP